MRLGKNGKPDGRVVRQNLVMSFLHDASGVNCEPITVGYDDAFHKCDFFFMDHDYKNYNGAHPEIVWLVRRKWDDRGVVGYTTQTCYFSFVSHLVLEHRGKCLNTISVKRLEKHVREHA